MSRFTDIEDRLQELQDWRKPQGQSSLSLFDFAGFVLTPSSFFAAAELLRPQLMTWRGTRFIADIFNAESAEEWMDKLHDMSAVQSIMNHVHISAILQLQDVSAILAVAVAKEIAVSWSISFRDEGLRGVAEGDDLHTAAVTLIAVVP